MGTRVQKRAVNLITGLAGHTYEDKLRELGLKSLRERRIQYDLVQAHKMINKVDRVDPSTWFNMVGQVGHIQTRNTAYEGNLVPTRSRTEIRRNFFSNRVVPVWNSLPTEVKESRSLTLFQAKLEEMSLT